MPIQDAIYDFFKRPTFNKTNTGRLAMGRPNLPPVTSVYGNGGIPVQRTMLTEVSNLIVPNFTVTKESITGNGTNLAGSTTLSALSDLTTAGVILANSSTASV